MFFIHEKEANSILAKSGLKHLVAVTPSIINKWDQKLCSTRFILQNRIILRQLTDLEPIVLDLEPIVRYV